MLRRSLLAAGLLAASLAGQAGAAPAGACGSTAPHWAASWGAAVDGSFAPSLWRAHPTVPYFTTLPEQTYRFEVRTSTAGDAVRVRLSNPQVTTSPRPGPVTFEHVTLGAAGAGSAVKAPRGVTFHGSPTLTLALGASAVSDPVPLSVVAGQRLAVSLYAPVPSNPPGHPQTYTTSYATSAGAGDHAADPGGAAFTEVQEPVFWLDALDVRTTTARTVVALGDSVTDGDSGHDSGGMDDFGMDTLQSWPSQAAALLRGRVGLVNEGYNGDTGAGMLARLQHDVLSQSGVTDVVLEIGTNDVTRQDSAATVEAHLTQLVQKLHARGFRVIAATLVPQGETQWNVAEQQALGSTAPGLTIVGNRNEVNRWIRSSHLFDGLLDIAAIVGQRGDDDTYQARYGSGDGVHPSTAGYGAIAQAFTLLACRS